MISTYTSKLKQLQIGDLIAKIPIIQGGMGVGISRSHLAGAVAKEGGVGIISTAQIGYDEEGFENDQAGCNLKAIKKHIRKAKDKKAVLNLDTFPQSHQERNEGRYAGKGYRQLLIDNYMAIFRIDEPHKTVYVVTIQYQGRNL